ncbi:MAG: hypothetical protein A3D89_01435 [Planctomycetes bacterium RIFCSPHIGHO2_02_FULL_52_58]|nr:MAG: hypothetical protein A3D89_01435 [Planctomycetes bacterium RIFCSPHIGHO2_02_FULL_52_58]
MSGAKGRFRAWAIRLSKEASPVNHAILTFRHKFGHHCVSPPKWIIPCQIPLPWWEGVGGGGFTLSLPSPIKGEGKIA